MTRPTGWSLIAGTTSRAQSNATFHAVNPATGDDLVQAYSCATEGDVDAAVRAAAAAFEIVRERPNRDRAALLFAIAREIGTLGEETLAHASLETGLTPQRLAPERERTIATLQMFGRLLEEGSWVRATIDTGDPGRKPFPKPDVRSMLRPVGPVAVFGAGNFPFAYSVAGTDTASALAAGCPVIVKGHPSHPGTVEAVAQAVARAVASCDVPPGMFSFLHSGGAREGEVGRELVQHPLVRAVGFTGSFAGGRAIAGLAGSRARPIPVFAEMGSVNPVFVLPGACESLGQSIAERLALSITNSNGQMCTCPGLIFGVRSTALEDFTRILVNQMIAAGARPLFSERVRDSFVARIAQCLGVAGVEVRGGATPLVGADLGEFRATPVLLRTRFDVFREHATLREECFGPSAILVVCDEAGQLLEAAGLVEGSLTATVFAAGADAGLARELQPKLESLAGRIIYNAVPTGVEVVEAMVHGGPFPATNQAHATAVGARAIERWCRPVAYQNSPQSMLPAELRDENEMRISRRVNGSLERATL